ncbi:MAG: YceI family protein [Betaproteobacteria bacterium]|nr:YceI family protein [Betaproteobacteria bacterium]
MRRLIWLLGLLAAAGWQHALAADWRMDPSGSRIEFVATFEKSAAPGVFKEFDTRLQFDPDRPAQSRLDVAIKVTSADMGSAQVNEAIRGAEWFDFARYPQAEFHATDIRRIDSNRYLARGILSLKGARQPLEVPFAWSESAQSATIEGELTVQRGPFGIGTGEWKATNVIGGEVKVKFKVRLRRAG